MNIKIYNRCSIVDKIFEFEIGNKLEIFVFEFLNSFFFPFLRIRIYNRSIVDKIFEFEIGNNLRILVFEFLNSFSFLFF